MITATDQIVPDSEHRGLVARLPQPLRDYALLARLDRPIGWWLLFWPCAWGVFLAAARGNGIWWPGCCWARSPCAGRAASTTISSMPISMRGWRARRSARWRAAGCARRRPGPGCCCSRGGLVVLLQLRWQAQLVALGSLALVAAYPFMKRITWWPQAWLGLVFTWGAPTGWVAVHDGDLGALAALYAGAMCWCIGYDTIYALQDREDDASSASAPARGRWAAR
jgi:4-hydroxybenzoate polyprenyltransferase